MICKHVIIFLTTQEGGYAWVVSDIQYHHKIDLCITSTQNDVNGVGLFGNMVDYWVIGKPL